MRVTIVPDDNCVIADGDALSGLTLPASPNIHAIQWYGTYGIIEYKAGGAEQFTDPAVIQPYLDVWQARRDEIDNPPPPPVPTLAEAKAGAERVIDAAASAARARFISSGVGQDAVYVVKGQQAEAYAAAGFSGPVPAYIQAEADATGATPTVAAQTILALRDAWNNTIGPAIEAQRIGGKKLARDAATLPEVETHTAAAVAALGAIQP